MINPFLGLDGVELATGQRIEAVTNYLGSETAHYDGMAGHVRYLCTDYMGRPCVMTHLDGLRGEVALFPFELMQEVLELEEE